MIEPAIVPTIVPAPWMAAPASLLLVAVLLQVHERFRAIFPEDPPQGSGRHQHPAPTPMVGWIPAGLASTLLALGLLLRWWPSQPAAPLLAALALAILAGYLDDRGKEVERPMPWHRKGLLLGAATFVALLAIARTHSLEPWQWFAAALWLFALTNAVNFLDNTDGVACSLGAMGLLLVSEGSGPFAVAGYAFLGVLPLNWPRPRVFLGDSGALGLGVLLAYATLDAGLAREGRVFSSTALLPAAVFALDFAQVVVARLILGVPPWEGDRRHVTHILMLLGLPRVFVAPLLVTVGLALYFGFAALGAG
jgi:UDP-GlcNAc:undecaprenyl-phosphate GlcNAc-1-phosphate transferase